MSCGHKGSDWDSHYYCMLCNELVSATEIDALRSANERCNRYESALREIAAGKLPDDNRHPLGQYAAMALRFNQLACAALRLPSPQSTIGAGKGNGE